MSKRLNQAVRLAPIVCTVCQSCHDLADDWRDYKREDLACQIDSLRELSIMLSAIRNKALNRRDDAAIDKCTELLSCLEQAERALEGHFGRAAGFDRWLQEIDRKKAEGTWMWTDSSSALTGATTASDVVQTTVVHGEISQSSNADQES